MEQRVIKILNSSDYSKASQCLNELLTSQSITSNDIIELLSLSNNLIISDFLEEYNDFTETDLRLIENYINENLDHTDRLFVSDLIEFATFWDLSLPYKKCLSFLEKYGDDEDYVLLATIDYLFESMVFKNIDDIYKLLCNILHNPESNQSAQVKSAFILFRITNKKEFLSDLIDLVVNGDKNNKVLLENILSLNYNGYLYFEYCNILKSLTPLELKSKK